MVWIAADRFFDDAADFGVGMVEPETDFFSRILQPLYMGRPNILMSPMSFLQRPYRWLSAITQTTRLLPRS